MTASAYALRRRSTEAVLREARQARDEALSALLATAAANVGTVVATAARGVASAGRSIVSSLSTARRRHAAIRQLQALDDRMLKDIGISRSDIPFVIEQQMAARRSTASAGQAKGGDIAAFPDRQRTGAGARALLRPAA